MGLYKPTNNDPYLAALRAEARAPGDERLLKRQRDAGKMTARERIDLLLDPGSFHELDAFVRHQERNFGMEQKRFLGDSVVTGWGRVNGRTVYVYSQDFTVLGGSVSRAHANKICKVIEMATRNGAPLIGLNDSGGARIQEGVVGLGGYADIFLRNVLASGVVPQISVIMGPCAGGAVYSPALTDFVFMVEKSSQMFVTGPSVLHAVTGETVSFEDLGGAAVHSSVSGVAHAAFGSEVEALQQTRRLLGYLPNNNAEEPRMLPSAEHDDHSRPALNGMVPSNPNKPYDMKGIITSLMDKESFFEIHASYAENIVVGFGRLDGMPIGIVANQPMVLAGALDIAASHKGARFVRFCDAFNIPLLVLEDVPGFMPGVDQEHGGIIREGAKLLYAFCEATVPKITVVTRKAYGGAYLTMNCKHIRSDLNIAWPSAELAVMGPDGAVNIIFRRELAKSADPVSRKKELVEEYRTVFANPYVAAEHGYVDAVIEPAETRAFLLDAFRTLYNKRDTNPPRKHGNIPL